MPTVGGARRPQAYGDRVVLWPAMALIMTPTSWAEKLTLASDSGAAALHHQECECRHAVFATSPFRPPRNPRRPPLDHAPDNAEILAALRGAAGIISDAAKSLHISRDALGELVRADAGLREALHAIREETLDLAESSAPEGHQVWRRLARYAFT